MSKQVLKDSRILLLGGGFAAGAMVVAVAAGVMLRAEAVSSTHAKVANVEAIEHWRAYAGGALSAAASDGNWSLPDNVDRDLKVATWDLLAEWTEQDRASGQMSERGHDSLSATALSRNAALHRAYAEDQERGLGFASAQGMLMAAALGQVRYKGGWAHDPLVLAAISKAALVQGAESYR